MLKGCLAGPEFTLICKLLKKYNNFKEYVLFGGGVISEI